MVALGIGLARLHVLLVAIAPIGLLAVEMLRRKAGYVVKDHRSVIALNAPLPGTFAPTMASVALVMGATFVALNMPAVPTWAIVVIGVVVGTMVALLWRRSALQQMAAIRGLERANGAS